MNDKEINKIYLCLQSFLSFGLFLLSCWILAARSLVPPTLLLPQPEP